jgi:Amt family ammonium transporter
VPDQRCATFTDICCDEEGDHGIWDIRAPKTRVIVAALLGTAILCLAFGDIALAQDAGPPACGGKVLEKCTPNSGDTAWMLTSVALVLMMTIPGLGLVLWRHGAQEERW